MRLDIPTKFFEAVASDSMVDDVMNLAASTDQEHLWIYFAKDDQLMSEGRWEASSGGKWEGEGTMRKFDTGANLYYDEMISGAMGMGADEVIFVHNHPLKNTPSDLWAYFPPSDGDKKVVSEISDLATSVGMSSRFFIVASVIFNDEYEAKYSRSAEKSLMIEFDKTGKIVWYSEPWLEANLTNDRMY